VDKIVKVRFGTFRKIGNFLNNGLEVKRGDICILEGEKGEEMAGEVVTPPYDPPPDLNLAQFKKILRKATEKDLENLANNAKSVEEIFKKSLQKIREKELKMKLIKVEKSLDGSKIVFYFTAEGRIDFRELVKDLAYEFRTRIEMRQIGVRDQARILHGYGTCGRPLCCTCFLTEFEPVSIKMAKLQNLTLNPTKISGVCGRLMCCLNYEHEIYRCINRDLPKYGKRVLIKDGKSGKVRKVNTIARTVIVELDDGTNITVNADDLVVEKTHGEVFEDTEE